MECRSYLPLRDFWMYHANILEACWFPPLNISFEADFRAPLLTTYMLQFVPPAKPHAGRVVLLPHSCYDGTDWRPCAEPYPLTSLVLEARRPTFPSWLHVCETVAAKVCQAREKKSICTRQSYWMWYNVFVLNSFIFLARWMQIVVNRSFTFLKWINTCLSSGASLHHCWQISTRKYMEFSAWKSRLHLLRWDPQHDCQ